MPTLLQINTVVNQGSTGRIAEEIGKTAIAAGWQSVIAHGRQTQHSASVTIQVGGNAQRYHHALATRLFDRHGLHSTWATRALIRRIRRLRPDVVHLHNIHGYYLNYKVLFQFFKEARIPLAWTLHDCWPFTGHCSYFDAADCDRWKNGCYSCPLLQTYPASWAIDRSRANWRDKQAAFTDVGEIKIVTPSRWLAAHASNSFLGAMPLYVIPYGIDVSAFQPGVGVSLDCEVKIGRRHLVLAVASQWDERKGLSDVLQLRQRLPVEKFVIVVVGANDRQIARFPSGIVGIGRTESLAELSGIYGAASVFVNPTLADNFPVTNLESLACGTPVVTYDSGGSSEAIDSATGSVVARGDVASLAAAVVRWAGADREKTRVACRKRAEKCFCRANQFTKYISLFEQMRNSRKRKKK